jgi:hypothetical protein
MKWLRGIDSALGMCGKLELAEICVGKNGENGVEGMPCLQPVLHEFPGPRWFPVRHCSGVSRGPSGFAFFSFYFSKMTAEPIPGMFVADGAGGD